jgi:hypothetical protein
MGTMDIPSLDIWNKFEDLSLPPFSPNLGFEETSFDDIFNNSLHDKSFYDLSDDDTPKHLHGAVEEPDCSLYNIQKEEESLDIENNLIFSNDLESSLCSNDSFKCVNENTVIIDHPYAQNPKHKTDFILNKSEDKLDSVPIEKLVSGMHKKSLNKKLKPRRKPKPRSCVYCNPSYRTKYLRNNNFDYKVKLFIIHIDLTLISREKDFTIVLKDSGEKI